MQKPTSQAIFRAKEYFRNKKMSKQFGFRLQCVQNDLTQKHPLVPYLCIVEMSFIRNCATVETARPTRQQLCENIIEEITDRLD